LRSTDEYDRFNGAIFSAYLVEQAFKAHLKKINPLLSIDMRSHSIEQLYLYIDSQSSNKDSKKLKSIKAKDALSLVALNDRVINSAKANIQELFDIRNEILHSIEDINLDGELVSETSVSALKAANKYISKFLKVSKSKISPITSKSFEVLQEKLHAKRKKTILQRLITHRKSFELLNISQVSERVNTPILGFLNADGSVWVEDEVECPACKQVSLQKIGSVDFEWEDGEVVPHGGYEFHCKVCDLKLSEYELVMARELSSKFKRIIKM
jgi:hypothetical protein